MPEPGFRSTPFTRPGGSAPGTFFQFRRPPTLEQIISARTAGVGIDPQTGRITGTIFSPSIAEKQEFRQNRLFAEATGATAKQLGLEGAIGEGSTFLRPEQTGALLALRSGAPATPILSALGGQPVASGPLPSRAFGTAAFPGEQLSFASGGAQAPTPAGAPGGPPLVILGAIALALLFLVGRRRKK